MKKLSSIIAIVIITAGLANAWSNEPFGSSDVVSYANDQSALSVLRNVINETDSQIVSAGDLDKVLDTVFIPVPKSETVKNKTANAALMFYPITRNAVYEYEYTSTDFLGSKRIILKIGNYSEKDSMASVNMMIIKGNKSSKFRYNFQIKNGAIYASNSFLSGPRLEIPSSIYVGKSWIENGNRNWVSSLIAKVNVPVGYFENCLRIKTEIGNGDGGSAERYYAKNIGLIYESWEAEDRSDALKLVSYKVN